MNQKVLGYSSQKREGVATCGQEQFPVPGLELKLDCCRLRNVWMGEEETSG